MKLNLGCVTEKGNYRSKNQDRIMCGRKVVGAHALAVACVCDGIGSFSESEIASQMIISGVANWFEGIVRYYPQVMGKDKLVEDLEFTLRELNELVYEHGAQKKVNIGCTMSLIFFIDWEYWIFHVGDSRIYYLRDMLFKMTQDEVVLKQVNGRDKTFLINFVGKDRRLSLNKQQGRAEPEDVFILGTDGLYKKLTYADVQGIFAHIQRDEEIETICYQLVRLMLERGERDNISCAVLKLTGKE